MNTCKGSRSQSRQIDISRLPVGQQVVIISQGVCDCCSGCRRVALWHPRPFIDPSEEGGSDWTVKAIARVRFGDGCSGPEVEVDWKTGVILDLMGCSVEVALELVEKLGTQPDETNLFTYGALVACCGAGGARGCATRTTATIATAADTVSVIPIPPFAYAVMIAPHGDATDFFVVDTTIAQLGSGAAASPPLLLVTGDLFPGDGWTLVGGAQSILVANAGAEELEYEVVFLIGV